MNSFFKNRLPFALSMIVLASIAQANVAYLDCAKDDEAMVCSSIPDEAPETLSAPVKKGGEAPVSMLTVQDLTAPGLVPSKMAVNNQIESADSKQDLTTQMAFANLQNKLKNVELIVEKNRFSIAPETVTAADKK